MIRKNAVVGILVFRDLRQKLTYQIEYYCNLDESIRKNSNNLGLKLINNCSRTLSARRIKQEMEGVVRNSQRMFLLPSDKLGRFTSILDELIAQPELQLLNMAS